MEKKHNPTEEYDLARIVGLPYGEKQILVTEAIAKIFFPSRNREITLELTKANGLSVYSRNAVLDVLKYLDTIEGIITVNSPNYPYEVEILPGFVNFYKTFAQSNILYRITLNDMRGEILLNNKTRLGKPNLNSENEAVIQYLISHPNKIVTKKEIETEKGIKIGKDFHKIVENLGFSGDLRKTFFKISRLSILFRNPISLADFSKLGIPPLNIRKK